MIRGLGIDLVENSRIKKIYDSYGYRFVKRILDNNEIKEFNISENKISFLAKRFASKEALSKSLGLGLYRKNLYPNTIRIDHDNYANFLRTESGIYVATLSSLVTYIIPLPGVSNFPAKYIASNTIST